MKISLASLWRKDHQNVNLFVKFSPKQPAYYAHSGDKEIHASYNLSEV